LAYIRGETREAGIGDDVSRDIEALVGRLDIAKLGFVRAEATLVLQPETQPKVFGGTRLRVALATSLRNVRRTTIKNKKATPRVSEHRFLPLLPAVS
jgi:hypothetical protein